MENIYPSNVKFNPVDRLNLLAPASSQRSSPNAKNGGDEYTPPPISAICIILSDFLGPGASNCHGKACPLYIHKIDFPIG